MIDTLYESLRFTLLTENNFQRAFSLLFEIFWWIAKVSQVPWAINLGLKKMGYFWRKLADTFSPTTLFVFVQNKQMTHHIKLLILTFSIKLISLHWKTTNFKILWFCLSGVSLAHIRDRPCFSDVRIGNVFYSWPEMTKCFFFYRICHPHLAKS